MIVSRNITPVVITLETIDEVTTFRNILKNSLLYQINKPPVPLEEQESVRVANLLLEKVLV